MYGEGKEDELNTQNWTCSFPLGSQGGSLQIKRLLSVVQHMLGFEVSKERPECTLLILQTQASAPTLRGFERSSERDNAYLPNLQTRYVLVQENE